MSKSHILRFCIFVVILFFTNSVFLLGADNNLKFNHITVNDGLLHNSATCITQDSTGFIWIGTQRGLNRFDGYKVDSYLYKADLHIAVFNNRIRNITVDGNYLWMATLKGLQCFDIRRKKHIDYLDENGRGFVNRQIIQNLFVDSQHRIWIKSHGLLECALITKIKDKIVLKSIEINNTPDFKLQNNSIPVVAELSNGTLVLLAGEKLFQLQTSKSDPLKFKTVALKTPDSNLKKIKAIGNDLWLFSPNKATAVHYKSGTLEQFDGVSYPECFIAGVGFSNNHIWLSTYQGLLKIDIDAGPNRVEHHYSSVLNPSSVSSNHQSGLFVDNQHNLWVSTWSGGVSYSSIEKQKFELVNYMPIKSNKYLPSEFVNAIHEDKLGDIYVGTKFGGISRFNIASKTFDYTILLKEKLGIDAVVPCIVSDDDWIYAAVTFQGSSIYRINKKNQKIELVKSYYPNSIFSFGFDKHKEMWVGVLGMGLSCLKIENGKAISEKIFTTQSDPILKLTSNEVNNVYNDHQKNEVFISTINGLNRLMLDEKGEVTAIAYYLADGKNPNSLSSNFVWPIDKENDSTYWVGTLGSGLNRVIIGKRVRGKAVYKSESFGTKQGAPSNDIESVLVDKFGNVWCGGRYLSQFNYKTKTFKTFYEEDGIQSYLFGTGTSCKTRSGMLFFGGLKGMNYFMPDTTVERKQYKIAFSRLLVDGQTLNVGDTLNAKIVLEKDLQYLSKVKIPYPCNNLTIEFSTLTFSQKKNIQYRYKLDGFDKNWVYTNGLKPYANYPKLPYKSYKFIVEVGSNGQWLASGANIQIVILPPWWLSIWAYLLYSIILTAIIYFSSKYSINWIKMKRQILFQNEREKQKEEMMEMKMNFFTNISHEFKTPLTLINASVSEIENKNEQLFGDRYFQVLKRNNSKLLHLISELMDFQRSNASLIELKSSEIDVCKFLNEIVDEFLPLSEKSAIVMKLSLPSTPIKAWVDEECLVKIITNIISNSLRYTEHGGAIDIQLSIGSIETYKPKFSSKITFANEMQAGEQLIFAVTDNGVGISAESLPDVFERFHTVASTRSKHLGSGVGLALVKSLVQLHKGGVLLSSERNVGTEFVFFIPLNSDYLSENQKTTQNAFDRQLYFDDYKIQILEDDITQLDTNDDTKPTLLLVDDNKDILMILSEHFKAEFNILIALDGEEALDLCNKKYPDIIISDVMMPKMNGLELCKHIKSQLNTCFIPVVLLTARGTTEQQIEGLDEGADAYMPKPFHLGLLHSTITNLLNKSKIANQRALINDAETGKAETTRDSVLDVENKKFIEKITQIIENNIANSTYTVDNLSLEMGYSRSRLYSQMKSITNETLGEFIREVRLQKGAELLRTTRLTVSEVALKVGVESHSVFTRSFKQRFGMPPTEYVKKISNKE